MSYTLAEHKKLFCWCGRPKSGGLCGVHKDNPQPVKRDKSHKFSGDSTYREKFGYFQSKEGR